jgi:uncharacterized protein YmfQ (DUF2313 family)
MNHAELLKRLLPPVAYDPNGALLSAELEAEGNALDAAKALADLILIEADPRTTYELLADWERVAGLPGECVASLAQTVEQRRAALVAKLVERGGQSRAYFIALAAKLGYTVTITEYHEWTVNDDVEAALCGADWNFAFAVNAPLNTVVEWTVESDVEMPFAVWGNELLECAITADKPAHTVALFVYS